MISLLERDMTRQEFLVTSGTILLGLIGVTALLKNLSKLFDEHGGTPSQRLAPMAKRGFGSGQYGA
jgi:hypothetical protein